MIKLPKPANAHRFVDQVAVGDRSSRRHRLGHRRTAGRRGRRGGLLDLDPADWSLSYAVNVDALFHLCRAGEVRAPMLESNLARSDRTIDDLSDGDR